MMFGLRDAADTPWGSKKHLHLDAVLGDVSINGRSLLVTGRFGVG